MGKKWGWCWRLALLGSAANANAQKTGRWRLLAFYLARQLNNINLLCGEYALPPTSRQKVMVPVMLAGRQRYAITLATLTGKPLPADAEANAEREAIRQSLVKPTEPAPIVGPQTLETAAEPVAEGQPEPAPVAPSA